MKISIIRGAFLNPFECQLYAPLARNHDLTLIGADWQFYPHKIEFPAVRVSQASLWGSATSAISRQAPIALNRMLSWTTGHSYGFYDLDRLTQDADILHPAETFFTMTHQSAAIKRKRGGGLVITVSENLPHMGETHPWRRRLKRQAIEAADHLIAITETSRKVLIDEGVSPSLISVIPWSMDLTRFRPAPKDPELMSRLGIHAEDKVILFIGRLIPEKGIRDILRCVSRLADTGRTDHIRFLFVGDGPLAPEIETARHSFPELILRHPFVPYDQLPVLHNLADIFILPSTPGHKIAEQFGFVLIESMASGKPIVTTTVGSIRDVVGEAAVLIEPNKPDQLFTSIMQLMESPNLRQSLGEKALNRVREHFDADKNAERLASIYKTILKRVA